MKKKKRAACILCAMASYVLYVVKRDDKHSDRKKCMLRYYNYSMSVQKENC